MLRVQDVGISLRWTPLALVVMNVTYVASAYPFGKLSDRVDRGWLLAAGLVVLAVADAVLALGQNGPVILVGVAIWGVHMGMTQGLLSAMVADAAPKSLRGSAFGLFYCIGGAATLLASLLAGILWELGGPPLTFFAGAGFSIAALAALVAWRLKA